MLNHLVDPTKIFGCHNEIFLLTEQKVFRFNQFFSKRNKTFCRLNHTLVE